MLGRMADAVLEDCLSRQLGLSAAADIFLSQCARMIHASSAFLRVDGSTGPVLTRTWGGRGFELMQWLESPSGTQLPNNRTVFSAPLSLGDFSFGVLGFVLKGSFVENHAQVALLVESIAEHFDSAVLSFLASSSTLSPAQRLDELQATNALEANGRIGRYQLIRSLGAGGMAQVMLAKTDGPQGISRLVALKRILPELVHEPEIVKQFLDEAKLAMRLVHPNLVTTHDFGEHQGTYFIAMELLAGADLDQLLYASPTPLPPDVVCGIVVQALEGLEAAHNLLSEDGGPLQLVHRDLSPHNIMVGFDGRCKVLDFGVAKMRQRRTVTLPGIVKGKPLYMSPEQACAEPLDRRSDVFSMGLILFESLAQRRAFFRETDAQTMEAIVNEPLQRPTDVDLTLWPVIERALAKSPAHRFSSAKDMAQALVQVQRPASLDDIGNLLRRRCPERSLSRP
jgi:eukaryotic-like serine/threonine-protein kinase